MNWATLARRSLLRGLSMEINNAEKPEAQISDSLTNAVIRTCDMCHAGTGGNLVQAGAIDSREVRRMLDVWWRFNLVTGNANGYSNAFADGYLFESF